MSSRKAASHVLMRNTTQQYPPIPIPFYPHPLPSPSPSPPSILTFLYSLSASAASFHLALAASCSSSSGFAQTPLTRLGGRPEWLKQPSRFCLTRQSHDRLKENLHCCGVCEVYTRPALSPGNIQQRVCSVLRHEMNHVSVLMCSAASLCVPVRNSLIVPANPCYTLSSSPITLIFLSPPTETEPEI